jgi:hypothetical protein
LRLLSTLLKSQAAVADFLRVGNPTLDRKSIVNIANKVNLKEYLAIGGPWQFLPGLRVNGIPGPASVLVQREPVKERAGNFI